MTIDSFKASVQYGDWQGTAAADNADGNYDLRAMLEKKRLYDQATECLIGAELYVAENQGGKVESPSIRAFIIEQQHDAGKLVEWLEEQDPIPVKCVELELTIEEFIGCFKRFSVVLLGPNLGLDGRRYEYED